MVAELQGWIVIGPPDLLKCRGVGGGGGAVTASQAIKKASNPSLGI